MSEVRLIDANALKELFLKNCGCDCYLCKNYYYDKQIEKAYCHLIDNAPTVEVTDYDTGYQDGLEDGLNDIRPQGKWELYQYQESRKKDWYCTACLTVVKKPLEKKYVFCPYCGADMRGDV